MNASEAHARGLRVTPSNSALLTDPFHSALRAARGVAQGSR